MVCIELTTFQFHPTKLIVQQPEVSLELDHFEKREEVISEEESLWMDGTISCECLDVSLCLLSESGDWCNYSGYKEEDLSSLVEWINDDEGRA